MVNDTIKGKLLNHDNLLGVGGVLKPNYGFRSKIGITVRVTRMDTTNSRVLSKRPTITSDVGFTNWPDFEIKPLSQPTDPTPLNDPCYDSTVTRPALKGTWWQTIRELTRK